MTQYRLNNRIVELSAWDSGNANREIDAKAWWLAFRNSLRILLTPNPDFKVGDIFRWQGLAGRFGHGFIIRLVGGGEWLICGSADGTDAGGSGSNFTSLFQSTSATYFLRDGSSPASLSAYNSGMLVCYNPDPAVSWNIGYDSNLALSAEYAAPTSNPYTALAAFWTASKAPFGIALVDNVFTNNYTQAFHVLIDDNLKMMRWDMLITAGTSPSNQRSGATKLVYFGGEGFNTFANNSEGGLADPSDTNQALNALLVFSSGNSATAPATAQGFGLELVNRFYVMNLAGTRLSDTTLLPLKDMTPANYKAISGKPKVRAVEVRSGSVLKGTLKKRVCLEAYPYRDGLLGWQIIEYPGGTGNKLIREHESCCFFWIDGKTQWPYQMAVGELPY